MEIKNSLDWAKISVQLDAQLRALGHNPDLQKMLKNIDSMVTELSKMEVEARRIHSNTITQPILIKINKAIDHLDKLLLMAKLMA